MRKQHENKPKNPSPKLQNKTDHNQQRKHRDHSKHERLISNRRDAKTSLNSIHFQRHQRTKSLL